MVIGQVGVEDKRSYMGNVLKVKQIADRVDMWNEKRDL